MSKNRKTDFDSLYWELEAKFNPYPVQVSRAIVFSTALSEKYITPELYLEAKEYFQDLWNYAGD